MIGRGCGTRQFATWSVHGPAGATRRIRSLLVSPMTKEPSSATATPWGRSSWACVAWPPSPAPPRSPLPATVAKGGLSPTVRIQVPVRTFDTWASTTGLERADLIKIDVEGAECDVLSGMRQTLDRLRPPRIICETMPGSEAGRLLFDRGYRSSMLDEIPGGIPNLLFSRVAV